MFDRNKLTEMVIGRIKKDLWDNEYEPLEVLLSNVSLEDLEAFLTSEDHDRDWETF